MKNSEQPKILQQLEKGMWYVFHRVAHGSNLYHQMRPLINEWIAAMPESFKTALDTNDFENCLTKYLTVEITTRKKGKVIEVSEYLDRDMIGKILEIDKELHPKLYYKQKVLFELYPTDNNVLTYVRNVRPKKFCCDLFKIHFDIRKDYGLDTDNRSIICDLDNNITMPYSYRTVNIFHCPGCGTEFKSFFNKVEV